MDNLLSGLGKFGLDENVASKLYEEETSSAKRGGDGEGVVDYAAVDQPGQYDRRSLACLRYSFPLEEFYNGIRVYQFRP